MRVKNSDFDEEFEKYLRDIGQGKIANHPDIGEQMIKIPDKMTSKAEDLKSFCDEVFPNLDQRITEGLKNNNHTWVHERAIICSQNEDVEEINKICLEKIQSNSHVYRSDDRLIQSMDTEMIPTEILNAHTPPGCPEHHLELKIGAPILLLRNLDVKNGHVNGAR